MVKEWEAGGFEELESDLNPPEGRGSTPWEGRRGEYPRAKIDVCSRSSGLEAV